MRRIIAIFFLMFALSGPARAIVPSFSASDPDVEVLSGGWRVFTGRIVDPAAAVEGRESVPVTLPHIWKNMSDEGPDGAYGIATYVRHVRLPGEGHDYTLLPGKIRTVYRYYAVLTDKETGAQKVVDLGGDGQPGPNQDAATHALPWLMPLPFPDREFDLVVQVSNNVHFYVGFIRAPGIAKAAVAQRIVNHHIAIGMAYAGILLAIAVYTMLLAFWHAGESYYYVSFAMLTTIAFRFMLTDGFLWIFFPDISFTTLLRLEYVTSFIFVPGYYALSYGLFPKEASKYVLGFLIAVTVIGCGMAAWAPAPVLFSVRNPYFFLGAGVMVLVFGTILRARLNRRDGASIALLGHIGITLSVVLDSILYAYGRPGGAEHVPVASLLFAFLLMWLFTVRYRKERAERTALRRRLVEANDALNVRAVALDKAQGDAEAALAMKASFLSNVSHEVRTPLNAIIGFADLLIAQSHGPVDAEKQREYLRLVRNNGQHLLTLMTDILSVSELEAGRFEVTTVETDPRDVVDMCVGFVAPAAHEKHLLLDVQCKSAEMTTDERLMRQAVIKILSNAVKYSPDRGVVTVRGQVVGEDYVLSVIDTGQGIDKEDIPTALELFGKVGDTYTTTRRGMGLGLPLVSRFMALLGGRMDIDSIKGVGTTVTLIFPLRRTAADDVAAG